VSRAAAFFFILRRYNAATGFEFTDVMFENTRRNGYYPSEIVCSSAGKPKALPEKYRLILDVPPR